MANMAGNTVDEQAVLFCMLNVMIMTAVIWVSARYKVVNLNLLYARVSPNLTDASMCNGDDRTRVYAQMCDTAQLGCAKRRPNSV